MKTNNTPATMNANEYSHAALCLTIYLTTDGEIYDRYTVPLINSLVETVKRNGWQLPKDEAIKNLTFWTSWQTGTKKAIQAAARLVKKYDNLTPTRSDIEAATKEFARYIINLAIYELEK